MKVFRYAVAVCLLMIGAAQATDLGAIWFIGDSITQSNADGDANGSPRKSLYDLLTANGYTFTYTGHFTANVDGLPTTGSTVSDNLYHYHSGVSGIRIGEKGVTSGFAYNMETYWGGGRLAVLKPDMILIMLGTNDVATPDGATNRLSKLVQDIYDLPSVGNPTIFLATIPPNGRSASDTAFVAAFNAEVPGIVSDFQAAGKDVRFVDQFTPLNDDYAANMMADNLHPNATGNDTMAQTWYQAVASPVLASFTVVPVTGFAPLTVGFDASSSSAVAGISSYSWDFGDGNIDSGVLVTNTYTVEGLYTAILTVTDVDSNVASNSVEIQVDMPVYDIATVTGVSTNIDAAYGSFASSTDLVNAGSSTLVGAPIYSATPDFGPADNDGAVGVGITDDITFWLGAAAGNTYSITYALDTSINTLGYDITSLRTIHGWGSFSGNQKNQNYAVEVSTVDDSGFVNIATVAYLPFDSADTAGSSMVTVSNNLTGILASGVDEIRFTYTIPATGGSQPSPTIREIDVFGEAISSVVVSGVSTNIDAAYGSFASSIDLVNAGSSSLAGVPTYSATPYFGPAENDGTVGAASTGGDITFWLGAAAGSTYSITYDLNTSVNTLGYDITSLQTIHGWTSNSGNQKNQNYTVEVSTVGDSGFTNIATVAYLPFGSETTTGSTKVTVTGVADILASGVDQIRFTYTIPASGGSNPSPTIREIDVFGEATIPFTVTGVSTNIDAAYGSFASATDLVNAGSATLASGAYLQYCSFFGPAANNDGTVGGANTGDITFWISAAAGNTYTISYALDTSANTRGYDITSLQTIHGWGELSGNQKNQNYTVEVSMVGDPGFTNIATVAYFPFPDPPNSSVAGSSMVTVSNDDTGVLASGVDEIRFVYTVPATGGNQPSPTIREIDVFGEATTADMIYIGDAAAEGTNVTSGSDSYSITTLTIVMHTGTPVIYTVPSDQDLKLTEVNFYTDATGTVTPFIARYDGSNSTLGSGYEILAIGDAFSVTDGTDHLENRAFTVGGVNPTISVSSGDQIVAGFLEAGGRVVRLVSDTTGVADYIYSGDSVTSQSVGDPLSANSSYNFDRSMKFNIGFEVLPAVPIVPTSPDGTVIFFIR